MFCNVGPEKYLTHQSTDQPRSCKQSPPDNEYCLTNCNNNANTMELCKKHGRVYVNTYTNWGCRGPNRFRYECGPRATQLGLVGLAKNPYSWSRNIYYPFKLGQDKFDVK